jgi:photosystem II stability/assembly factor-like uncharacterized protein
LPGNNNVTLGIDFIDQNHGITGGWYGNISQQIYGYVYYTYDGGTNWIGGSVPDSMRVLVDVQMINDNVGYGAGAYNQSVTNANSNTNQNQIISPALQKYYEQIGMDLSRQEYYRGYFVETTDGGLTWHPKGTFEDSVYYLVGISFVDQNKGFVIASPPGGSGTAILETTDGGNNWNFLLPFHDGIFVRSIRLFEQIGYLVYENIVLGAVFIAVTTDGGMTWAPPLPIGLFSANKVSYANAYTILISGVNEQLEGLIYRSTDGGNSWEAIRMYDELHFVQGVDAVQNSNAILVYGTYQPTGSAIPFVDISLNGGANWSYSQLSQFQDYLPLYSKMVDELRWYLTGTQNLQAGFVLFTDNSGGVPVELVSFTAESAEGKVKLKWTTATELNNLGFEIERKSNKTEWRMIGFKDGKGTTTETQNYVFIDDLFGVKSEHLYYRLKQIDYDGSYEYSDVIEVTSSPMSFQLYQNFPNPFNPSTSIQYAVSSRQFVNLKVYDVLGNEVAILVNLEQPAGSYNVEFRIDNLELSSGVYFYRIQAGNFVETKKMILMK